MTRYPYKSEDMMLTRIRSRDNGALRLAIAFWKRSSIGELVEFGNEPQHRRWRFVTTPEWNDWAENFMNLPGLFPHAWSDDPQWAEFHRIERDEHMQSMERMKFHRQYSLEFGPKRMILALDTEEQAMLFKMRWQDET